MLAITIMIENRSDISSASRIVLKAGTSVVSNPDGFPSLTRIANIVESASRLVHEGKQVMLVTSGLELLILDMIELFINLHLTFHYLYYIIKVQLE